MNGSVMRKLIILGVILGTTGCATLGIGNPPVPSTPATPVFFQPFSSSLDQAALSTIASAAKVANVEAGQPVVVIGAADNNGDTDANKVLSKSRAEIVARQLVTDGVEQSRIHASGVGETGAPADMSQYSRRVLIKIGN